MNQNRKKLLCLFVREKDLFSVLSRLKVSEIENNIVEDKVFVFRSTDHSLTANQRQTVYLTFNVDTAERFELSDPVLKNLVLVHRKKETNTLYTINALNQLKPDEDAEVDWASYSDSIIYNSSDEVMIMPIELSVIYDLKENIT